MDDNVLKIKMQQRNLLGYSNGTKTQKKMHTLDCRDILSLLLKEDASLAFISSDFEMSTSILSITNVKIRTSTRLNSIVSCKQLCVQGLNAFPVKAQFF